MDHLLISSPSKFEDGLVLLDNPNDRLEDNVIEIY
jgi:hypothetical protein